MSCGVALRLLRHAFLEFFCEVHASLVGQTDQHPQHVGHLFAQVGFLARLEALVAIFARYDTRQFAHLFREAGHVGEL